MFKKQIYNIDIYLCFKELQLKIYLFVSLGVAHGDDVLFVLNTSWVDPTTTQKDRDMQKHLLDFWVLFATEG